MVSQARCPRQDEHPLPVCIPRGPRERAARHLPGHTRGQGLARSVPGSCHPTTRLTAAGFCDTAEVPFSCSTALPAACASPPGSWSKKETECPAAACCGGPFPKTAPNLPAWVRKPVGGGHPHPQNPTSRMHFGAQPRPHVVSARVFHVQVPGHEICVLRQTTSHICLLDQVQLRRKSFISPQSL